MLASCRGTFFLQNFRLAALTLSSEIKMAFQPVKGVIRNVKPLLSVDEQECRRRVISLYKAWYRQIPETIYWFNLPLTVKEARTKLKKEFMKNKYVRDIRVIDMLVIKGQMELKETVMRWKQVCHVMYLSKDTHLPRPTSFLAKFLSGTD